MELKVLHAICDESPTKNKNKNSGFYDPESAPLAFLCGIPWELARNNFSLVAKRCTSLPLAENSCAPTRLAENSAFCALRGFASSALASEGDVSQIYFSLQTLLSSANNSRRRSQVIKIVLSAKRCRFWPPAFFWSAWWTSAFKNCVAARL